MKRKETIGKPKKTTISLRQYYYLALLLPLVFPPFLFFPLPETDDGKGIPILFYLVVFGVIQYVVFTFWTFLKYRRATAGELKEFSYVAPFYFVPFYAVGFILGNMLASIAPPSFESILMLLAPTLISIPIGYCYVALAHLIGRILEKIGFIEKEYL